MQFHLACGDRRCNRWSASFIVRPAVWVLLLCILCGEAAWGAGEDGERPPQGRYTIVEEAWSGRPLTAAGRKGFVRLKDDRYTLQRAGKTFTHGIDFLPKSGHMNVYPLAFHDKNKDRSRDFPFRGLYQYKNGILELYYARDSFKARPTSIPEKCAQGHNYQKLKYEGPCKKDNSEKDSEKKDTSPASEEESEKRGALEEPGDGPSLPGPGDLRRRRQRRSLD